MAENWEGAGGRGDHRTVGPHRAWCSCTGEWCYPHDLCPCCDQARIPEQWRGMNVGDVLEELRSALTGLDAFVRDADEMTYIRLDDVLGLLGD